MKNNCSDVPKGKQKAVLTCEVLIEEPDQNFIRKKMLIDYNLYPLRNIIECGGIDHLITTLRMLHNDIVEASLASYEKGEHGIFENNPDLIEQLFYIKQIADCFDEIKSEAYQLKKWPVVAIRETV